MKKSSKHLALPLLVILLGVAWLLNAIKFMPDVDWIWTAGLGTVGVMTLGLCGLNKFSMVIGPFFIIASITSVMRQTGNIVLETEIPVLIIVFGCLLLLVQAVKVPLPAILSPDENKK